MVDSNIIVASFLASEANHAAAKGYIDSLENGDYVFHLPMLVVVEVTSAIARRVQRNQIAFLAAWEQNIADWESDGKMELYPLNRNRMFSAAAVAKQYRFKGLDSVIVALANELDMPLRTYDSEIQRRFRQAST